MAKTLREELEIKPIIRIIENQRLWWFGHLNRINESKPVVKRERPGTMRWQQFWKKEKWVGKKLGIWQKIRNSGSNLCVWQTINKMNLTFHARQAFFYYIKGVPTVRPQSIASLINPQFICEIWAISLGKLYRMTVTYSTIICNYSGCSIKEWYIQP